MAGNLNLGSIFTVLQIQFTGPYYDKKEHNFTDFTAFICSNEWSSPKSRSESTAVVHSVVGLKITFKSFLTFKKTTVAQSITFLLLLVALLFCKGVRYSLLLIRTDSVLQLFPGFFFSFFFYSSAQFRYRSVTDLTPY